MEYRVLGKTGLSVSRMGLGGIPIQRVTAEDTKVLLRRLMEMGVEIVVVACNTATAAAISTLRKEFPIKFIGMEPAIKPAAALTKTGVVGVLATAGTLKAEKYLDTREKWAQSITVVEHTGEGFVELVEKGQTSGAEAEAVVQNSLVPLLEAGADTIVLGCTHYPFLADTIKKVAAAHGADGNSFHLIDPAPAVARHLLEVMEAEGIQTVSPEGFSMELLCSGDRKELLHTYNSLV
jgi:glutamate racemase